MIDDHKQPFQFRRQLHYGRQDHNKLAIELAGKLLISTGELLLRRVHPGILKDEVASPGGTTIAGIAEIERYTFRSSLIEAVRAATLRGAELGEEK